MAVATAASVLCPSQAVQRLGGNERKERAQKELPEELKVYGGKEAAVGEGWGLPKGECVEQIINCKSNTLFSQLNKQPVRVFFLSPKKLF